MHAEYLKTRNTFSVLPNQAKTGSLPHGKTLLALLTILLFMFTTVACGDAYSKSYSKPDPTPGALVEIRVTAATQEIAVVGGTVSFRAEGGYRHASGEMTYAVLTTAASWNTSNSAIATVDNGVVTGTGIGTATISATFGGLSGSVPIYVATAYITISPQGPFSLSATRSVSFEAIKTFSDGSTMDVSGAALWNSSHGDIVSVYPYAEGFATLVATGTTTITATLDTGEVGTLDVTVDP